MKELRGMAFQYPYFLHFLGERKASTNTQYDFISSVRKNDLILHLEGRMP